MVGLPLGLLTARWTLFRDTLGTTALGLQTLPSVCWVPLALLWFGQTEAAMFFVVIMGTLWSVIIATETGVRNVPADLSASRADDGIEAAAYLVQSHLPGVRSPLSSAG